MKWLVLILFRLTLENMEEINEEEEEESCSIGRHFSPNFLRSTWFCIKGQSHQILEIILGSKKLYQCRGIFCRNAYGCVIFPLRSSWFCFNTALLKANQLYRFHRKPLVFSSSVPIALKGLKKLQVLSCRGGQKWRH